MSHYLTEEVNRLPAQTNELSGVLRNIYLAGPRGIVIICGETRRVRDANPAALALLNKEPEQVVDRLLSELTLFRNLPDLERVLDRLADTGCTTFEEVPLCTNTRGTDFLDITFHPYLVSRERVIVCNLHIVTARRRRRLRESRLHTMAALAGMAEHVARELNSLLPVISASSEMALGPGAMIQPSYKALEEVQKARGRLAVLARGLQAFSGRQTLQLQPVDLNQQLATMDARLCELLGDSTRVEQQLTPGLPPARTDAAQLQSVILTLASFARRRMPLGGTFRILTRMLETNDPVLRGLDAAPGRYLCIKLVDSGKPLDAHAWAHLFEPFDGGDENGLAMAAAYGIVKQCGGHISVSAGDAGASFAIYLPSAEHCVAPLEDRCSVPSTAGETIVLVEEEEGTRNLVRNLLSRKGYRILEAQAEDDVRRVFAESNGSIHLLIAHVKSSSLAYNMALAHPHLKLIYISGSPDDVAEDHPGPLPPDAAVLQKPFRLDTLLAKIRSVLDNKPSVG